MAAERAQSPDYHEDVQRYSRMYSIEQWLQPRSMVQVQLAKLEEETRCPMCFRKVREARISMVCLHRYCRDCIEQYLRAKVPGRHGDEKECPVCRAHLHSRRATKPDPGFDRIIKALYGDVDQYDAEENALLEQDNKAHIAAWQAQLADMKARQAAAVAAARGVPQGSNGQQQPSQEQTAAGRTPGSQRPPTPSAAGHRPAIPRAQSGLGHADGTAAGLGSRKRSWGDLQQQRHDGTAAPGSSKASRFGVGNDVVEQLGKLEASRGGLQHQQQQRGSTLSVQTGLLLGAHDRSGNTLPQQQFSALVQQHSGTKKKKKHISARDMAARLLGVAARAAAAAPITRCCLIHLQPHGQQSSSPGGAAAPVGRSRGRSRKPGQQQQLQIQQQPSLQDAPTLDQPFLTCPWGLTVSCLKEILLQQLSQQGMGASANSSDVQLLLAPECGEVESGSSSGDGGQAALGDDLTVGQLYERWWGLGPEVQIQYRLLNQ